MVTAKIDTSSKILTVDALAKRLAAARKKGKKIALCHGIFDLLHPGHLKHFESAKRKADILVVTLTKDEFVNKGPGRPVFNHFLRAEAVAAIECVDFVAVNEWPTAVETIRRIKPHYYVKGSDYTKKEEDLTGKIYDEEEAVRSVGGTLYFTDEISFSSTSLINSFLTPMPEEAKIFFSKFKKKHSAEVLIRFLKKLKSLKVLVIGDIIIDEYHYCRGMGKTPKDNIVATKFLNHEVFAGGVLATCNHLAGFCDKMTLVSAIGAENSGEYRQFIYDRLKPNVRPVFFDRKDAPTVVKRRFIEPNFLTKLFEVCYLDDTGYFPPSVEDEICKFLHQNIEKYDLVLAHDFGHGVMTPKIIKLLSRKAKFLAANVQTNSSNIGFNVVTKFPRADYICIDEPELRLACHDKSSKLEDLILKVSKQIKCRKIIITRGHRGSLVYSAKEGFTEVPVFSKEVVDRIGAGDAFFSISAPCVSRKMAMEAAGVIGNAAGAMQVLIVGNRSSVEPVPLFKYLTALLK